MTVKRNFSLAILLFSLLVSCAPGWTSSGKEPIAIWECEEKLPLESYSTIHPIVRANFGGFHNGQVAILSKGVEFNIWYCPRKGGNVIYVRDESEGVGLNYEIKDVFSYSKQRSNDYNLVVLFKVGRAIPGMHDVGEYAGEVYHFNGTRGNTIEAESDKLTGVKDAKGAREKLQ